MRWNTDRFLELLYEKNVPAYSFDFSSREEWSDWKKNIKNAVWSDLGMDNIPQRNKDLNVSLLESVELEHYTRQRVAYTLCDGLEIPAYVLIPKGKKGKLPAAVACHGHGFGSREIVGLNSDGTVNTGDPGYQKNFAIELAMRGFITIVPELIGFGDTRLSEDEEKPMGQSSCYHISTYLLMMGITTAGLRAFEVMRTIDYLLTREDVDPDRIGCMGISGGGLVCGFAAALDERIKAAVVSGYTNTFKDSVMSIFHCVDNFIPGIVKHAEMPDIISMIAPRPLLIESGIQDPIFPIEAVDRAYDKIVKMYDLLEVSNRIDKDIFEGDHQIWGQKAYSWMEKWLGQ